MIEPSNARLIAEMRLYAACPACGEKAGRIDHLYSDDEKRRYRGRSQSVGPCVCDECGAGYRVTVTYDDHRPALKPGNIVPRVAVERAPEHDCVDTLTLLRFPNRPDAYLVVAGTRNASDRPGENERYFYDEHTCPTNYLDIEAIWDGADDDPHGIFAYVATIDRPVNFDDMTMAETRALFDSEIDWEVATGESYRDTLPDADDEPKTGPPPLVFDLQPSGLYTLRRD